LKRTSRRISILASTLLALTLLTVAGRAQDNTSGPPRSAAQVRAFLSNGTLTPAELRQRLKDAGQTDDEIDAAMASYARRNPRANDATRTADAARPADAARASDAAPKPDTTVARRVPEPGADREPFGFEIFRWSPTTFEPLSYGPVDPDYPLGPGDELALTVWGDDQLSITVPVNREGFVTLPDVGQVNVQGLTLEETRARIRSAMSRVYSGLRPQGQRSTTYLSLSLGRLRTIQVFLLGQVVRPGSYTLSSVSRVLNALYAAGGPSRDGSLRDVRVLRGGHNVASVDLYDVILGGDPGNVARLQNGDVIFVPAAERRVAVRGPVRRPALYELRTGEQMRSLLRIAGDPLPEAELSRAQIDRVTPAAWRDSLRGQGRVSLDVALGDALRDSTHDIAMADGDTLTLFKLLEHRANYVEVTGHGIARAGRYEYRPGMRASDLIAEAGGLGSDAYGEHALVTRTLPDSSRLSLRFAPSGAVAGGADNLELRPMDVVTIRSVWDLKNRQTVSIHGRVRMPGTYELPEDMTLADLLLRAGGLTDDADPLRAEISRSVTGTVLANSTALTETLEVALDRDPGHAGAAQTLRLQPHDAVFIRRDPTYFEPTYVTLEGEVRFPGTYALMRRDERVTDLVRRAGGLTEFAYARGASFARQGHASLAIDLPHAIQRPNSANNIVVLAGDTLRVPRFSPTVQIEGAVYSPSTALWQQGAGIGFYVTQASGFREDADRRNVVVIAPNGHVSRHGAPEPGSKVVVPARPLDGQPRDHLKDFATMMSVIASMATTIYLVHQSSK